MEIAKLFGLPAHPLLVHAAVVLLPLAAVLAVVVAVVPRARPAYAWVAVVLAVVATGFVGLAQGSGEALEESVRETPVVEEHAESGESVLPWAAVMTAAIGALAVGDEWRRRSATARDGRPLGLPDAPGWVRPALSIVTLLVVLTAVGGTVQVIRVGHSGARATWEDTVVVSDD